MKPDREEALRTRLLYYTVAGSYGRLLRDVSFEAPEDLAMIRRLVDLLSPGARVLDAGCGAGRMLTHLHALDPGLALTGLDLSPAMIAQARAAHPDLRVLEGDLRAIPVAPATFAGVLAWYSIIHLAPSRLPDALAEFHRVLAPAGVVLLAFQAGHGERIRGSAYGHEVDFRAVLFDPGDVAGLLDAAGFEVVEVLDRPPRPEERDRQAVLLARRGA